jgi:hypothetical protein
MKICIVSHHQPLVNNDTMIESGKSGKKGEKGEKGELLIFKAL